MCGFRSDHITSDPVLCMQPMRHFPNNRSWSERKCPLGNWLQDIQAAYHSGRAMRWTFRPRVSIRTETACLPNNGGRPANRKGSNADAASWADQLGKQRRWGYLLRSWISELFCLHIGVTNLCLCQYSYQASRSAYERSTHLDFTWRCNKS